MSEVSLGGRRINALGRMDGCPIGARLLSRGLFVLLPIVQYRVPVGGCWGHENGCLLVRLKVQLRHGWELLVLPARTKYLYSSVRSAAVAFPVPTAGQRLESSRNLFAHVRHASSQVSRRPSSQPRQGTWIETGDVATYGEPCSAVWHLPKHTTPAPSKTPKESRRT